METSYQAPGGRETDSERSGLVNVELCTQL